MNNYFCDTQLTTGANNGTSMDDAWQSIKIALENIVMVAGDILWIRRRSGFWNPVANITSTRDGTLKQPIQFIGWPRDNKIGTGTFENGSNVVNGVSFSPKFEQHVGRYVKSNSDGRNYLLTAIAHKINYDNKTGDFTKGLMLTGGSSGLEAKIHRLKDNGDGTGTLWTVTKARELIDRGNCEDALPPMIFGEFVPVVIRNTWERDFDQKHNGLFSYRFTKAALVLQNCYSDLVDNNNTDDMHGLIASKRYKIGVWIRLPSTLPVNECTLQFYQYDGSWQAVETLCLDIYDEWQYVEVSRTLSPTATAIIIRFHGSVNWGVGDYFNVDDISVQQVFEENEQITDEDTGVADIEGNPTDDGIIIDRPYVGINETGALTIAKDEDYDLAQTISDSGWTIKKSDYNGDADDLPIIDFGESNYYCYLSNTKGNVLKNLLFKNGSSAYGTLRTYLIDSAVMIFGCLFSQYNLTRNSYSSGNGLLTVIRCIMRGKGSGSSTISRGIDHSNTNVVVDCALYDLVGEALNLVGAVLKAENININFEIGYSTRPTISVTAGRSMFKDIKHTGYVGQLYHQDSSIENYQKVKGAHKRWYKNGTITKVDVLYGSGDPYKRPDGADSIAEVTANQYSVFETVEEWAQEIFCHEIWADKVSRSYRYYVQCKNMSCVSTQLWLEVEYIDQFDGESKYHHIKVRSDEVCAERTGVDDWNQYIEVTDIQSAVEGWVRIRAYIAHYDVDGMIFIDPKVEIT